MKRFTSFSFLPRLGGRRASFKLGVIATLAIAVAANIAVLGNLGVLFGNVVPGASHSNLLEPHLQALETTADASGFGIFRPVYDRLSASLKGRAETALYQLQGGSIGSGSHKRRIAFLQTTPSLARVLGVDVVAGRSLTKSDSTPGAPPVIVVSASLARARFGSPEAALGQTLRLDRGNGKGGTSYRIVGVHSPALEFPSSRTAQAWVPFPPESAKIENSVYRNQGIFAVVRPGPNVTAATIKTALARAYRQALANYPPHTQAQMKQMHFVPRVTSVAQREYGPVIKRLQLLELAALLLLLLVSVNLTGLATSDALTRRHELATRAALGAGAFRLFLGRALELGFLGIIAWVIGVGLGWLGHRALAAAIGQAGASVALSPPLLALSLVAVLIVTTLLAVPGIRRIRRPRNLLADLTSGGHSTGGRRLTRALHVFIALQFAVSAVLLVIAGNLYTNVFALTHHDLGFATTQRAFFSVALPGPNGCHSQKQCAPIVKRKTLFDRRLLESLSQRTDIKNAAMLSVIPLSGSSSGTSAYVKPNSKGPHHDINDQVVSKNVTKALGLRVLAGDPDDLFTGSGNSVVVDATAAAFYWPGVPPDQIVGRSLYVDLGGSGNGKPQRVVAIVAPLRMKPFGSIGSTVFVSADNHPIHTNNFVVHSALAMPALRKAMMHVVEAINPQAKLRRFQPARQLVAQAYTKRSQLGRVFGVLAVVALLIAAIGLFALLAYRALVRRPEFAIRGALGATPGRLLGNVFREACVLWGIGCVIGVPAAYGLSIVLTSYLPKLGLPAAWVAAAVVIALGLTALVAALVPARRAADIDLAGNLSA
ncbi:MAG: FtsX-like permease family protein [Gammaproteobacteria bacterium]